MRQCLLLHPIHLPLQFPLPFLQIQGLLALRVLAIGSGGCGFVKDGMKELTERRI